MMKIKYPESFWEISKQIGYARNVMNKENNKKNTRYDRGIKNNHVDTLGVLGELIVMDYLIKTKTKYQMAQLIDYTSSKNADFIINEKKIDVKTNSYGTYYGDPKDFLLLVNKEAHKKGLNKINTYWFVCILNKTEAEFYFIDYKDIDKWDYKNMGYTEAYYIKRDDLLR